MHKVFISHHHDNDQWYKEELVKFARLLHKPKNPLLPRSIREQTPRKSVIPAKAGIQRLP